MGKTEEVVSSKTVDRKSFILGMITAFSECLANECKKAALSPPFYPEDYDTVRAEAETIAKEQGIHLWYDENLDIPEVQRVNWYFMYKFPEVFAEYGTLREKGYNPAWDFEKFFDLLSYGTVWGKYADRVTPQFRERRKIKDTVSRILFMPGDWPISREQQ